MDAADTTTPEGYLTPQQLTAIAFLCTTKTVLAAAKKTGVSESTIHRWMTQSAEFRRQYRRTCDGFLEMALAPLHAAVAEAVAALVRNLKKPAPASTQVRAALGILSQVVEVAKVARLEEEMQQLREMLANVQRSGLQPDAGSTTPEGESGGGPPADGEPDPGEDPGGPDPADADGGDAAGPLAGLADP